MIEKFVAYYRVSTTKQSDSGLGLESQEHSVESFLRSRKAECIAKHVEVESGAKSARPMLEKAVKDCKRLGARLVIAKLDRLSRNVHFVSGLMESGVDFVAVDNPHANRLMLHLLAAFAEHERMQISERTKQALAAAKARGVVLGKHGKTLAAKNRGMADDFALKTFRSMRILGIRTDLPLEATAASLNLNRLTTFNGSEWTSVSVCRLRKRLEQIREINP